MQKRGPPESVSWGGVGFISLETAIVQGHCPKSWVDQPPHPLFPLYLLSWMWRRKWSPISLSVAWTSIAISLLWISRGGDEQAKKVLRRCWRPLCHQYSFCFSTHMSGNCTLLSPVSMVITWGFSRYPCLMTGHPLLFQRLSLMRMWQLEI